VIDNQGIRKGQREDSPKGEFGRSKGEVCSEESPGLDGGKSERGALG